MEPDVPRWCVVTFPNYPRTNTTKPSAPSFLRAPCPPAAENPKSRNPKSQRNPRRRAEGDIQGRPKGRKSSRVTLTGREADILRLLKSERRPRRCRPTNKPASPAEAMEFSIVHFARDCSLASSNPRISLALFSSSIQPSLNHCGQINR